MAVLVRRATRPSTPSSTIATVVTPDDPPVAGVEQDLGLWEERGQADHKRRATEGNPVGRAESGSRRRQMSQQEPRHQGIDDDRPEQIHRRQGEHPGGDAGNDEQRYETGGQLAGGPDTGCGSAVRASCGEWPSSFVMVRVDYQ